MDHSNNHDNDLSLENLEKAIEACEEMVEDRGKVKKIKPRLYGPFSPRAVDHFRTTWSEDDV